MRTVFLVSMLILLAILSFASIELTLKISNNYILDNVQFYEKPFAAETKLSYIVDDWIKDGYIETYIGSGIYDYSEIWANFGMNFQKDLIARYRNFDDGIEITFFVGLDFEMKNILVDFKPVISIPVELKFDYRW
jgi:hypothetical protein